MKRWGSSFLPREPIDPYRQRMALGARSVNETARRPTLWVNGAR